MHVEGHQAIRNQDEARRNLCGKDRRRDESGDAKVDAGDPQTDGRRRMEPGVRIDGRDVLSVEEQALGVQKRQRLGRAMTVRWRKKCDIICDIVTKFF